MSTLMQPNLSPSLQPDRLDSPVGLREALPAGQQKAAASARIYGVQQNSSAASTVKGIACRLLIPVDATERSRWGIGYALAQHRAGNAVEAHLLTVAEPITSWQVLRFRRQNEIAQFQAQRAQWLLDDAAATLQQVGIPVQRHFRAGDIAFEILDAAEQLACSSIVLPLPRPRWLGLLSKDIVRVVQQRANGQQVVTVDQIGLPQTVRTAS